MKRSVASFAFPKIKAADLSIMVTVLTVACCSVIVAVCDLAAQAQSTKIPAYASGQLLVGYKESATTGIRRDVARRVKGAVLKRMHSMADRRARKPAMEQLSVSGSVLAAVESLQNHPDIAFVEPNYVIKHTAEADDYFYLSGDLWGVYGNDAPVCGADGTTNNYGTDAEEAWYGGSTGSKNVYVGVIDEGIQVSHPDLADNIWVNPFDAVDGVDNDGNGYVDDTNGWDFFHGDRTVFDPNDGDDHGTHVAGTIGAKGGNGLGVSGVNWNVNLISTKFLGPNGGYISDAIAALDYLRDLKVRHGLNIVVANNSWGGGGYSSALHTAIIRAAKQGILFVAAAGNSGSNNDVYGSYPSNYSTLQSSAIETSAGYEAVIAVAAIQVNGSKAYFSNYGANTVDLGAPGVSIASSVPTDSYASYSGTSMAAPHVSGAVALYSSAYSSATSQTVRAAILGNTTPNDSLAGVTVTGGSLNLDGLFAAVATVSPTTTATYTPSATPSSTPTFTATVEVTATPSATPSSIPTVEVTVTVTPSATPTATATVPATPITEPTSTATGTPTPTPSPTSTIEAPAPTMTTTATATPTVIPTVMPTVAITVTAVPEIRDVAVTSIIAARQVRPGRSTVVTIMVRNQGNQPETITTRLRATAGSVGDDQLVTLAPRERIAVDIPWTAPRSRGLALLTARAIPLSGETDLDDNARRVLVRIR